MHIKAVESFMKNICVFTNTLLKGGAEKQAILLAKALRSNHNVWLVVYYGELADQKYIDLIQENKLSTVYLKGNHINRIFNFIK